MSATDDDAPPRRASLGRRLRRLAMDRRPLQVSRDFRLLWWGELVSQVGHQITTVALFVQVFRITGSSVAVGVIGLLQFGAMTVASFVAGPVIDRRDRRQVLLAAQAGQALASSVLLVSALMDPAPLALVYAAAALNGALVSVALPARAAMTPNLVPVEMLPAANAMNQVMWNAASIVGPALGGVIVSRIGLGWAYGVDVATYGVAFVFVLMLRPMPPRPGAADEGRGWDAVLAGVRYLRGRRVLQSTFTVDVVAMVFGMPRALFPVLAIERFGQGEEAVGWMFSAIAAGGVVGVLSSGWVGGVQRMGRAITVAVALWGAAIVGFGLSGDSLPLALLLLAIAGGADVISAVFRSAVQQLSVPDALRGRLSSFNILVVAGGPRVGDFEAGAVAALFTPTVSVVSGGLACLAGVGVIALAVPRFLHWRVGDPP